MNTVAPTFIRVPFTKIHFELSAKDKKVMAVALASIALFGLQLGLSWAAVAAISMSLTAVTYLSERFLRTDPSQQNDWFNTQYDKKGMLLWASTLFLVPVMLRLFCFALGLPLSGTAQEGVVEWILKYPWKAIPTAVLVAPLSEEILFRGFLMERFEDGLELVHRHIRQLPTWVRDKVANVAQAVIFGALHLRAKIKEGLKIPILISLSCHGYIDGYFKKKDGSLFSPMTIHAVNNAGAVIQILTRG